MGEKIGRFELNMVPNAMATNWITYNGAALKNRSKSSEAEHAGAATISSGTNLPGHKYCSYWCVPDMLLRYFYT